MKNAFKKALNKIFGKKTNANDIFVLLYFAHYVEFESWEFIEDVVEKVYGERPDWHKCKKIIRNLEK